MKLLFNLYEVAARLGVPIGTVLELVERKAIQPHGYVYEQAIPLFEDRELEKARSWLAKNGERLPLGNSKNGVSNE